MTERVIVLFPLWLLNIWKLLLSPSLNFLFYWLRQLFFQPIPHPSWLFLNVSVSLWSSSGFHSGQLPSIVKSNLRAGSWTLTELLCCLEGPVVQEKRMQCLSFACMLKRSSEMVRQEWSVVERLPRLWPLICSSQWYISWCRASVSCPQLFWSWPWCWWGHSSPSFCHMFWCNRTSCHMCAVHWVPWATQPEYGKVE